MQDRHVDDLVDAYALGALEPGEVDLVERHIAHCEGCLELLKEAQASARELLYGGIAPIAPPPALRARVLDAITKLQAEPAHNERVTQVAQDNVITASPQPAPASTSGGLPRWLRGLFGGPEPTGSHDADALLRELLEDPECIIVSIAGTENAPGASGRLIGTPGTRRGVLLTTGLPPVATDRAYQVWFLRGGKPQPNALFRVGRGGHGASIVQTKDPMSTFEVVAITPEPASGSPGPTGPIVLAGELTSARRP